MCRCSKLRDDIRGHPSQSADAGYHEQGSRYYVGSTGRPRDRRARRHVAQFILVAPYAGTRRSVCAAALQQTEERAGSTSTEAFLRRPTGARETRSGGRRGCRCPAAFWRMCAVGNGWGRPSRWTWE